MFSNTQSTNNGEKIKQALQLAPLLPMTISMIVGMVLSGHIPTAWLLAVLTASIAALWLLKDCAAAQTGAICLCFTAVGMLVGGNSTKPLPDGEWSEAVVVSEVSEKPKTMMAELFLTATGERRRCYIWKDANSRTLHLGDELTVRCNASFVRWDSWRRGGNGWQQLPNTERLRVRALWLRHSMLEHYRTAEADEAQYGVLAAMTLGDKSALTPEVRETYSVTGASHVLALSGLHLGIIYLLLTRLTLGRRRGWLPQVFVVLAIWGFALITGLSTSVVRSATMISTYALFSLGGRRKASVNVLCFTAIIMLLVDPQALYDIGFQLSFSAVMSILLWMPLLDRSDARPYPIRHSSSWPVVSPILNSVKTMMLVSVAAQAGTAPLVAYYFHRFSTYFLLTNLVVIPVVTIILYGTVLTLVIPALTGALMWVVGLLNDALQWMSQLPMASIDGLYPSVLQVCMVYVVIGTIYLGMRLSVKDGR